MATPKRVLIVDDDSKTLFALQSLLQDRGYDVVTRRDAESAAELDVKGFYAAVIDVRLPGMQGVALAHELTKRHEELKVIFITAYDDLEDVELQVEGSRLLIKPLKMESLYKLL